MLDGDFVATSSACWRARHGIYLHLQTHGMAPKEIACITKAYEQTLRTLCVQDRDDPLTELVAKTIIKIVQTGIKDPAQISAQAISELEMR